MRRRRAIAPAAGDLDLLATPADDGRPARLLHAATKAMDAFMHIRMPALFALGLLACPAVAEPPRITLRQPVRQAAFDRDGSRGGQQTIRFGRHAVRVGDQTEQHISLEMRMTVSMLRSNQLFEKNQTQVQTKQRRVLTTDEVADHRTMAATVHYAAATRQMTVTGGATTTEGAATSPENSTASPLVQPVQGKTYRCRREPGEGGKLIVTDELGNAPPSDEYEIVAPQMEMVGHSNPLADYLAGRTIAVGEKLTLPNDVARQIFNLSPRFGEVTQFQLTLAKVQNEHGVPCAEFRANVEAASQGASQMRLQVEGPLVVEVDSCRAVHVALAGPIGMSESRGTYSTAYQVVGTGRLQMSVTSTYRDASR
jgi:hypothetical protein